MAVREKTREQRPSETAKAPPAPGSTRAPAPGERAPSKRPLVDAHKGDPAARARASIVMQKQAGNARATQMMSAAEVSPKTPVKISVTPPTVVKAPTTAQAPTKEPGKPVVTTKVSLTPAKPQDRTVGPAAPDKEKPAAAKSSATTTPTTPTPPAAHKAEPAEAPAKTIAPETATPTPAPEGEKKEAKGDKEKKEKPADETKAEGKGEEKAAPPSPREAVAPAVAGVRKRAKAAHKKSPPGAAVHNAELSAKDPQTEQQRGASSATVTELGQKANEAKSVERAKFIETLKHAIDVKMGQPKTESEAKHVMNEGAKEANADVGAHLSKQRESTEKPLQEAGTIEAEPPAAETKVEFKAEEVGTPPQPVSAAPVVPESLPPERLDYSKDREPADQEMEKAHFSDEKLEKNKESEPEMNKLAGDRSEAKDHEEKAQTRYRDTETKIQHRAHAMGAKELSTGLGAIHGSRELHVGKVAGQQTGTRDKGAAERTRITNEITGIKNRARGKVTNALAEMQRDAPPIFSAGLTDAERIYAAVFKEEKGGTWTWLTTWGDDWEELIEHSLAKAKKAYLARVEQAIGDVADFIDRKLTEARQAVADGRKEVDDFVKGLDSSVQKFGVDAQKEVDTDFATMDSEIDASRDAMVNTLTDLYAASYKRMSDMEEKLREENKSLWRRIYDATIGLIKKIIAFVDMLIGILRKAAELVWDIIGDPIGFLGNLIDGVMLGLKNFMSNIGTHLLKGIMDWLFGALGAAGLELPDAFDLKGIVSIILQILGLTYANFRKRAVAIVGEPIVSAIEKTAEVFKVVMTEGIPGIWRLIKEKVTELKAMVLDAIFDYLKEKIIIAGIEWVIGLLNPASAFFKACKAIYEIVKFFIERGAQIIALVNAIIDSVSAIVKGNISVAATMVENALAKAIPVAIGFLASLLGLGDISSTIRKTIDKAQEPINKAIDWVINLAVKGVKAVGKLVTRAFGKKDEKPVKDEKEVETGDAAHDAKVTAGLNAIDEEEVSVAPGGRPSKEQAEAIAARVKEHHPVFQSITVVDGGDHWIYSWTASKGNKPGHKIDPEVKAVIVRLRKIPANKGVGKLIQILSKPLTENMRKGYLFQSERTIYWDDEGLLLRIEYKVTNPSTEEVSVFDIVINDPEGTRDENGKKVRLHVDTKNWEATNELLELIERLEAEGKDDSAAFRRLERSIELRIVGLRERLDKYRRTGLNIVIEWSGDVPERIRQLNKRRRGALGSVTVISIPKEME